MKKKMRSDTKYVKSLKGKGLKKIGIVVPEKDEEFFKYMADITRRMYRGEL